ncbi:MAG: hypothetical protein CM1200mP41_38410 [Gammaproteobacteria bacterium]|nr:MAG: hypothetical protein CM1200mP41_38410 [Gammaproteobacteria bacterium]
MVNGGRGFALLRECGTSQLPAGLLGLQKRVDRVVPRKGGVDVFWNGSNRRLLRSGFGPTHADTSLDLVDKADEKGKRSARIFSLSRQSGLFTH